MINVCWVSYHPETIAARHYWDQGLIERTMDGRAWHPPAAFSFVHHEGPDAVGRVPRGEGAVVVVPGQHHASPEDVKRLNEEIARLAWALVIVTGDECALFPAEDVQHDRLALWIMDPRPSRHRYVGDLLLGTHFKADTFEILDGMSPVAESESDWFFAGQVTHERRRELASVLKRMKAGLFHATPGFTQGYPRDAFLNRLTHAKVALCPSGPATPDSFRLWEALEAGALPVAEHFTPERWDGFWDLLLSGEAPPFPIVKSWRELPKLLPDLLARWPANATRASAWWVGRKRKFAYDLRDTLRLWNTWDESTDDRVTVLIPTSPIPSHPSTAVIEETVASVRERLPFGEIIVMCDGVRAEQEDRREGYETYLRRLVWLCQRRWRNVLPVIHDQHRHQGAMTREALDLVRTSAVLFVEHDTPLVGEIPFAGLLDAIDSKHARVIRLHHEDRILDVHKHLMVSRRRKGVGPSAMPMMRTVQWSQRPHLASTAWYRTWMERYFPPESRTMIEDRLHSVVQDAWDRSGERGWDEFRLWIYTPPGDIKRSTHLDGRGDDPKYEMVY